VDLLAAALIVCALLSGLLVIWRGYLRPPLPQDHPGVLSLLRALEASPGRGLADFESDDWAADVLRSAQRHGFIRPGVGWSVGVTLTGRGERFLRAQRG